MHDLKMKRLAVDVRSNEETLSDCRKSKQLTGRRLLDPEDNAWDVTLISVN